MTTNSPSWNLSRYVRAAIISNNLPLTEDIATRERIEAIAGRLGGNGHDEITGYDADTVRAILLDESLIPPYRPEAPDKYSGR